MAPAARPAHPSRVVRCTRKWVARHLNKSIRYLGPCPKSPIFAVAVLRVAPLLFVYCCLCCLCNKLARHWSTPKTSPEGHDRRDVPGSCRARSPALHVGGRDRVASWSWSRTSHPHAHLHAQLGLISASAAPSAVIDPSSSLRPSATVVTAAAGAKKPPQNRAPARRARLTKPMASRARRTRR